MQPRLGTLVLADFQTAKMATAEEIARDAFMIHRRLFDHRAVIRAECKNFVKEFETKKNDREYARLREVTILAEKIGHSLPECKELAHQRLTGLQETVTEATNNAQDILSRESKDYEIRKHNKEKIEKEWKEFEEEMKTAKEDVEKRHQERMEKLREQFEAK